MSRETADTKDYVSILSSDGTFRLPVPEGTPGEVKREWSVDDKTGVKNELVFKALTGKITNVSFVEADFGTLLQVEITDENGPLVISTTSSNNFAIDLMEKIPALDLSKEYRLAPFSFENEKGKQVKGVSITEVIPGKKFTECPKVKSFFKDGDKLMNGMIEPEKGIDKLEGKKRINAWRKYFMDKEEFLVDYITNKMSFGVSTEEDEVAEEIAKDF
jgi:hypothetical protein